MSKKKSFIALLFLLPGSIFTWFLYMFPSDGSYRTIRISSRWYRSTLIKFFLSCIFWFIILPYLILELTETKTLNYLKNDFKNSSNDYFEKTNKYNFNSISNDALCLAFSNNENKSLLNQIEDEMKKRQINCNENKKY